jgi:iron complex transport system substrate-binding protein
MKLYLGAYLTLLMIVFACGSTEKSEKKTLKAKVLTEKSSGDELNELAKLPNFKRIVCIGEGIIEVLIDLGDSSRIVAIDRNQVRYPNLNKLPKVGYRGTLKARYVLEQKPDLVLAEWDGCSEEIADEIQNQGVTVFRLRKDLSLDATKKFIRQIAAIAKKMKRGEKIIEKVEKNYAEIKKIMENRKDSVRVLFVHARGPQVLLAGGLGSPADELIKLAGGKNVAGEFEGLERLNPEDFLTLNPTFIIMSRKAFGTIEGRLYEVPELVNTIAYRTGRLLLYNDNELMNPGIYTGKIALDLAQKFYRQQIFAPLPAITLPPDQQEDKNKIETKKQSDIEIIQDDH